MKIIQNECYTFDELKEGFNWSSSTHSIQAQITFARKRNVIIEKAYKKGKTYFKVIKIISEENLIPIQNQFYTFKQLNKIFNWPLNEKQIENMAIERQIDYAKHRKVIIEKAFKTGSTYFKLLNFINQEWKQHPLIPQIECSREGYVRNKTNHHIYQGIDKNGYCRCSIQGKKYSIHRLIKETFDPIQNSQEYVVDHINGKKDDNRLENLRWCYQKENVQARDENNYQIKQLLGQIIQKIGYEKTYEELQLILQKILGENL